MYDYNACNFKIVSIIVAICLLDDLIFSLSHHISLLKRVFYHISRIPFSRHGYLSLFSLFSEYYSKLLQKKNQDLSVRQDSLS